jgi:hypothetical protein
MLLIYSYWEHKAMAGSMNNIKKDSHKGTKAQSCYLTYFLYKFKILFQIYLVFDVENKLSNFNFVPLCLSVST